MEFVHLGRQWTKERGQKCGPKNKLQKEGKGATPKTRQNSYLNLNLNSTSYRDVYENKVVDPSRRGFCSKIESDVTSSFAQNCKKCLPNKSFYKREFFSFLNVGWIGLASLLVSLNLYGTVFYIANIVKIHFRRVSSTRSNYWDNSFGRHSRIPDPWSTPSTSSNTVFPTRNQAQDLRMDLNRRKALVVQKTDNPSDRPDRQKQQEFEEPTTKSRRLEDPTQHLLKEKEETQKLRDEVALIKTKVRNQELESEVGQLKCENQQLSEQLAQKEEQIHQQHNRKCIKPYQHQQQDEIIQKLEQKIERIQVEKQHLKEEVAHLRYKNINQERNLRQMRTVIREASATTRQARQELHVQQGIEQRAEAHVQEVAHQLQVLEKKYQTDMKQHQQECSRLKQQKWAPSQSRQFLNMVQFLSSGTNKECNRINGISITRYTLLRLIKQEGSDAYLDGEGVEASLHLSAIQANMEGRQVKVFPTYFASSLLVSKNSFPLWKFVKKDIFNQDLWLIPVHLPLHWLLVEVRRKKTKFTLRLYDSLGGSNKSVLNTLEQYIIRAWHSWDPISPPPHFNSTNNAPTPRQLNGTDCGVFAILVGRALIKDHQPEFSQEDIPEARIKIALELFSGKLQ